MPGNDSSCREISSRSLPASITYRRRRASCSHACSKARALAPGMARSAAGLPAIDSADGKAWVTPSMGAANGSPTAATSRAAMRAPFQTCRSRGPRVGGGVGWPGERNPGRLRTSGARTPKWASTVSGSASRSSNRRQRCTAAWASATLSRCSVHPTAFGPGALGPGDNATTAFPWFNLSDRR